MNQDALTKALELVSIYDKDASVYAHIEALPHFIRDPDSPEFVFWKTVISLVHLSQASSVQH